MANYIPFEKLEVGKTYWVYSRYWHQVLGRAMITEICFPAGACTAAHDWNPNPDGFFKTVRLEANDDYFWDECPTEEEQRELMKNRPRYEPPRELKGKLYSGTELYEEWKQELRLLCNNLQKTFEDDDLFDDETCISEEELDYPISELLIRYNGSPDWESISFVEKNGGFKIRSGERDSFGWLTGLVADAQRYRSILFG